MPVYNGELYLDDAIDSILGQTFKNFEFIIINDGSKDKTEEIILSYKDDRICYLKNEINLQIVKSLNKSIRLSKGKYIARMDADDISLPNRIEKQINFMEKNPDIDVCGTWMRIMDNTGNKKWVYPKEHDEIKAHLLFNTPISHPSIIIKRSFFDDFMYSEAANKAEDDYLWHESIDSKKFFNIPEALYLYRLHSNQTCNNARDVQVAVANQVRKNMLSRIGITPTTDEFNIHCNFSLLKWNEKNNNKLATWLNKIIKYNKKTTYFDELALNKMIGLFWWKMHRRNTHNGLPVFFDLVRHPYHKYEFQTIEKYIVFFIKCLIRKKPKP